MTSDIFHSIHREKQLLLAELECPQRLLKGFPFRNFCLFPSCPIVSFVLYLPNRERKETAIAYALSLTSSLKEAFVEKLTYYCYSAWFTFFYSPFPF